MDRVSEHSSTGDPDVKTLGLRPTPGWYSAMVVGKLSDIKRRRNKGRKGSKEVRKQGRGGGGGGAGAAGGGYLHEITSRIAWLL